MCIAPSGLNAEVEHFELRLVVAVSVVTCEDDQTVFAFYHSRIPFRFFHNFVI